MVQAGFSLVGKRELPGGFGVANCEANRHLLGKNWSAEACEPKDWSRVSADVVFGNPPCSGFSVMSVKSFRGADSPVNECMFNFVRYVAKVQPVIAVFESVQLARTSVDGRQLMAMLRSYLEDLTDDKWSLYHVRHNALSVGGAAMRRRYFWLVSRIPFGIEIPAIRQTPTLNDVIGDLTNLPLTWLRQPYRSPASWWSASRRAETNVLDGHITQGTPLESRIMDLLRGVRWLPSESISAVARRHYEAYGRLPTSWAATERKIVANDFHMGYTIPVKWNGDAYARVITGGALCTVLHPTEDRLITYREAARIVGFPDDWVIRPLRHVPSMAATWGKGITVDCGRWIGSWIREALDGTPGKHVGTLIGDREWDIDVTHAYRNLVQ
ncbi:MAG: hypothetical protein A2Y75_05250 [Candidatus Solincola sediminis]|uniref:DNA (cytosine-5-)-methyltransferase n=1 Tax=Candidatus Solincola sediminis TaxID=1797199 RepID=A0A1F2WG52_9ACTN|nr:MAG: hypothetical protein A2Y75_05250 [Candidatus Solincola sediminis]